MYLVLNIFYVSRQIVLDEDDICEINFIDDCVNISLMLSNSKSFDEYMANFNTDFDINFVISDISSLLDSVPLINIDDQKPIDSPLIPPLTLPEPSNDESSKLKLKTLPDILKYVFLSSNNTFLVIINSDLTADHEQRLITLL